MYVRVGFGDSQKCHCNSQYAVGSGSTFETCPCHVRSPAQRETVAPTPGIETRYQHDTNFGIFDGSSIWADQRAIARVHLFLIGRRVTCLLIIFEDGSCSYVVFHRIAYAQGNRMLFPRPGTAVVVSLRAMGSALYSETACIARSDATCGQRTRGPTKLEIALAICLTEDAWHNARRSVAADFSTV